MEVRLDGSWEVKSSIILRKKKKEADGPPTSRAADEKSEVDQIWLDIEKSAKSRFNLPSWESLKSWYNCAISEDILKQGILCVFKDWLVFYCDLPMLEVEHCIPVKNIKRVTPEVTAFFFSNALKITMKSGREYMFRSFVSRDEAMAIIEERIVDIRSAVSEEYIDVKGGKVQMVDTMQIAAKAILNQPVAAPGHVGDVDLTIPNIPKELEFELLSEDVFPISSKLFVQRFMVNDERPWNQVFEDDGCLDIVIVPWATKGESSCQSMVVDFWKKLQPGEIPKILGNFERVDVHREYRRKANPSAGVARMHILGTTSGVPYADSWCSHEIWNFTHCKKGTRLKVEFGIQWLRSIRLPGVKGSIKSENSKRTKEGVLRWIAEIKNIIAKDSSTEDTKSLQEELMLSSSSSSVEKPEQTYCGCQKCIIL